MATNTQINLVLEAQNKASKELQRVSNDVSKLGNITSKSLKVVGTAFKVGAVAVGAFTTAVGIAGVSALKTASDFEQNRISLETMLGSAEKAGKLMQDITKAAKATPFELPELVDSTKMLIAFGVEQDKVIDSLVMLGDVSAGIGAPVKDIAEIYGKAKTQGRLFAEDINQLTGRGIPIIKQLAKQFGVAEEEIKKLVENGKVGFPELEKAFQAMTGGFLDSLAQLTGKSKEDLGRIMDPTFVDALGQAYQFGGDDVDMFNQKLQELGYMAQNDASMMDEFGVSLADVMRAMQEQGQFAGLMEKQAQSFSGVISNLTDNFTLLGLEIVGVTETGEIIQGGLFDILKNGLQTALSWIEANKEGIIEFVKIGINFLIERGKVLVDRVIEIYNWMKPLEDSFVKAFNKGKEMFESARNKLNEFFKDTNWLWVFIKDELSESFNSLKETAVNSWNNIMVALEPLLPDLKVIAKFLGGAFIVALVLVIKTTAKMIEVFLKGLTIIIDMVSTFREAWGKVGKAISSLVSPLKSVMEWTGKAINKVNSLINKQNKAEKSEPKQYGGSVMAGNSYLVGERGPEMFIPSQSGNIRNQTQMPNKEINININNPSVRDNTDITRIIMGVRQTLTREQQTAKLGI